MTKRYCRKGTILKLNDLVDDWYKEETPTKFPVVDKWGDVWISKNQCIFEVKCSAYHIFPDFQYTTKKEKEIYWRYRKAWKLMNR